LYFDLQTLQDSSVWRAVSKELLIWLVLYYAIAIIYRCFMNSASQEQFEKWGRVCAYYLTNLNFLNLSMFLGFYVSYVSSRWWSMYQAIPWIDKVCFAATSCVGRSSNGTSESRALAAQQVRKELVRLACLNFAVAGLGVSAQMRNALASPEDPVGCSGYANLVKLGILTPREVSEITTLKQTELPRHSTWWLPISWAIEVVASARDAGIIASDVAMVEMQKHLIDFRDKAGTMLDYDMIGVPLIYTQATAYAVYVYFGLAIVGRAQYYVHEDDTNDDEASGDVITKYFPIFSVTQFILLVGWLKVAGKMLDPYGADGQNTDATFDLMWIFMRNLEVSKHIMDRQENPKPLGKLPPSWNFDALKSSPASLKEEGWGTR
jgi:hypothetical protein